MSKFGKKADKEAGKVYSTIQPGISDKSRLVAFLLCYIFGFFGAHRFYAEKNIVE